MQQARDEYAEVKEKDKINSAKILKLEEKVSELELRNRQLEDYSIADSVILHGIPPVKTETEAFNCFFATAKVVNLNISDRDLNACHSIKPTEKGSGRIVVKFCNRWLRNQFL